MVFAIGFENSPFHYYCSPGNQMKNKIKLTGLLLLFFGFSASGTAAEATHHGDGQKPSTIPFPQEIKPLITQEMQALQQGMHEIVPAIVSGDWSRLEETGRQMRDSYIMKRKLTKEQKKRLHASLPESFKKEDQAFHHAAGKLSRAAENRNMELVLFYYYKMAEACVNCHSQHATHRFPALTATPQEKSAATSECNWAKNLAIAIKGGEIPSKCKDSFDEENAEEEY
ncbi:MAG TPA: hypothetical protein ENI99_00485 [Sedimenticola sp.]|nr:hypothetical protein [Sedimenticola sp.]